MARGYGEGSVTFDHRGTACKDTSRHRNCTGRWIGVFYFEGARQPKVYARTKGDVQKKITAKREELSKSIVTSEKYTLAMAVDDWLARGLPGRGPSTIRNYGNVLRPVIALIGDKPLTKLIGDDIRQALNAYGETRGQSATSRAHVCLRNAIKFARSRGAIDRNVAEFIETPEALGGGHPSKSFTLEQMLAILHKAVDTYPMDAYIHISMLTGLRTEEARALRWDDVELEGLPSISVVRSVRRKGETKTRQSRRGLALPAAVVAALVRHKAAQDAARDKAGELWHDTGLVFTNALGLSLRDYQVLKEFREVLDLVDGIESIDWTSREMRHTFTSVLDKAGVPTEEISRLLGHSTVATTETVYRHELTPVRQAGAKAMDNIVPLRSAS